MYHVIIIEDDPMVASINKQYVESASSFTVDGIFKNGLEALSYLESQDSKNQNPDLIILDYYTPIMTGSQFIDRLHAMGKAPSIIMVTSANDTDIVQSLLSRGVLDYLVKPFTCKRFLAALERFVHTRTFLEQKSSNLSQEALDQLLSRSDRPASGEPPLAKGLNEATLSMIRKYLADQPGEVFTSEQIAEQTGLSRITIRRYMNWLTDQGEISSVIDYKTGGRPSIKYGLKSDI